ncbi:MAG TPA: tetratricopeptide repeat protein [Candidatus Angelobacter sp.]|nr:tetratricopeptide repeat protein [Candidatus Angelobacter sp.]
MKQRTSGPLLFLIFVCLSALGQNSAWETPIQAGKDAMARRQYGEAEKSFREALTVAEKFGEKDARFAGSLLFLAQACDAQGKTDEADALAGRAVESMNKALKAYKPKKAEQQFEQTDAASALFDKAADIFASHQKYTEAEGLYQRVVQIRESAAKDNPSPKNNEDFFRFMIQATVDVQGKLASAQEKLGNLYFTEHKFPEAAATYEKAQKIREANTKTDKRVFAQTLTNLATSYAAQDKYAQAEPLYQRALKLFEEANWAEKPETASTMQLYALTLKKMGRDEEARAMLEKVSDIRKKLGQTPQ